MFRTSNQSRLRNFESKISTHSRMNLDHQVTAYASKRSNDKKLVFGQILIGPPGSGKSTFCKGMYDMMKELGRNVFAISLDPGNDIILPYESSINVCDLITVNDTMKNFQLGPNGALIHSMEILELNYNWLIDRIVKLVKDISNPYLIIDCPGQVELFIHNNTLKNVIEKLISNQSAIDLRLVCVNLIDSYYANDPGKYILALFTTLNAMLHFELPHVNILSKLDLMEKHKPTEFNVDFYCEVYNLEYLLNVINDDPFFEKYKKLSKALTDMIESDSLVNFVPVNINDKQTMINALNHLDKANGFFLVRIETEQHKLRMQTDYTEMFTGATENQLL